MTVCLPWWRMTQQDRHLGLPTRTGSVTVVTVVTVSPGRLLARTNAQRRGQNQVQSQSQGPSRKGTQAFRISL